MARGDTRASACPPSASSVVPLSIVETDAGILLG